jgi:chorismate mutase
MEKLIHQFEFGLFVWQINFVNFLIEKICLETILDAVNRRIKSITFCRKCKKRNAKPSTDNQRILQEAEWSVTTC